MKQTASTAAAAEASRQAEPDLSPLILEGFVLARLAVRTAAEAITTGDAELHLRVATAEQELDSLERQVDASVAECIARSSAIPTILACLKISVDLERIGDLVLSFSSRGQAMRNRILSDDIKHLALMARSLEQSMSEAAAAFAGCDMGRALTAIRMDAEIDRLRNLILLQRLECHGGEASGDTIQIVFMAQALERAGDHVKNIAEEVIHLVSGHSVKHLQGLRGRSYEQLYLDWLKDHK